MASEHVWGPRLETVALVEIKFRVAMMVGPDAIAGN
jgi:hypothetical protein